MRTIVKVSAAAAIGALTVLLFTVDPSADLERVGYFKDNARNRVQVYHSDIDPGAEMVLERLERQTYTPGTSLTAVVFVGARPSDTVTLAPNLGTARGAIPEGWAYRLTRNPAGAMRFDVAAGL